MQIYGYSEVIYLPLPHAPRPQIRLYCAGAPGSELKMEELAGARDFMEALRSSSHRHDPGIRNQLSLLSPLETYMRCVVRKRM